MERILEIDYDGSICVTHKRPKPDVPAPNKATLVAAKTAFFEEISKTLN